jgi:hypothetical protein
VSGVVDKPVVAEVAVRPSWRPVAAGAALVAACAVAGWWLTGHGVRLHLGSTYPVAGRYGRHLTPWLALPLVLGVAAVRYGPRLAGSLPWRRLMALSFAGSAAWAVGLALVDGLGALAAPLTAPSEYLHDVPRVTDLGRFLPTFAWYIVDSGHGPPWTTHVSGHPPLVTLIFVLLARAGLPHAGFAAALCVLAGASAAPSVLSTVRLFVGEARARAAVPFVTVAPAALWIATSADGLFAGVSAAGICALAHAARRRSDALALAGGLALGACLYLSYGLVLLAPLAVTAVRPFRLRPVVVAAAGVAVVVVAFAAAGFWWLDGFQLAARRVVEGAAHQDRPWTYFLFANPAALAVAVGPAVLAALPAVRDAPRLAALPRAALLAVAVAVVSNLSKGEVERIYLPWAVWLTPLAAALAPPTRRGWFAAQVAWALLIAATTTLRW